METVKAVYSFIVNVSISMGVDEKFAFIIPFSLLLIFVAIIVKTLFSGQGKDVKNKADSTVHNIQPVDGRIATRRFDRTEVNIKGSVASYTTDDCEDSKVCEVIDVSLTGVGISCREELEQDSRIRICLPNYDKNDKEKVFYVSGSIVRIKKLNNRFYEYGIHLFHTFKRESRLLQVLMDYFKS